MTFQSFNDIVGNKTSTDLLKTIVSRRVSGETRILATPQAYIIDGPSGAGKTALAKLFVKEFLGEFPKKFDFRQYSKLSSWEDLLEYPSILFEDAHTIPKESWDYLCIQLDSSAFNSVFVFTTTDYARLPANIKSRAFRVPLSNLTEDETVGLLSSLCAKFELNYALGALKYMAQATQGNPNAAMTLLQKCDMIGEITIENAMKIAPNDLDSSCVAILTSICNGGVIEAQRELARLSTSSTPEAIVNGLFTTYSAMYLGKIPSSNLAKLELDYTTGLFLKWKQGMAIDSICLPLLLAELAFPPKRPQMIMGDYEEAAVDKTEPVQREIGARELARILHAKVVNE